MSMAMKYAMKKRMAKGGCDESAKGSCMAHGGMAMKSHEMPHDEDEEKDLISRAMAKRYSKGGKVSNEDEDLVDSEPNEFDDLVKDDHLDFHETAANSGDEDGEEHMLDEPGDMVARAMRKRKKEHNPRPA